MMSSVLVSNNVMSARARAKSSSTRAVRGANDLLLPFALLLRSSRHRALARNFFILNLNVDAVCDADDKMLQERVCNT